ncbi:MAG: ImmA/IrrE family metallo-endopeptidase [Deltaproteobacteria bacterium]|nr:ImmA/IrrE family metallo-endopeptidase [Deltaproteobacteria bacterium]
MKYYKKNCGQFPIRVFYTENEIESCAIELLQKCSLLPTLDKPEVDVDMALESGFKISPSFDDLSKKGVHGAAHFRKNGSFEVVLDGELSSNKNSEKRYRSTLAHEIGHVVLHRHLFINETLAMYDVTPPDHDVSVLCRDFEDTVKANGKYNGEWWEWQANRFMSALLMPKFLITQVCRQIREQNNNLDEQGIKSFMTKGISLCCNVSQEAARIRLEQLNIGHVNKDQLVLEL